MRGPASLAIAGLAMLGFVAQDPQRPVFRANVRTVAVYATVQERDGRLATNLTKDDFQVLEDGKPTDVTMFSNDILPFTAVVMIDMSDSMMKEYSRVKQSAQRFVDALLPADRISIGSFGFEIAVSPLLTGDKAVLKRVIDEELWPGGPTPLWLTAKKAMDALSAERGRRVVLFLSDGRDFGTDNIPAPESNADVPQSIDGGRVRRQAENDELMFYAIGMEGEGLEGALISIVEDTGGGHFQLKRNADLESTFAQVADELHHQYTLGFTPRALDGKAHVITVRVTKPGLKVRARKSYIARGERN